MWITRTRPRAGLDLGLVADPVRGEVDVHARGDDVLRTEHAGELEATAHVVVVEVRLEHVRDGPAAGVEDRLDAVDVALRVDHERRAVAADDVAAVTQVGRLDGDDVEVAHVITACPPAGARSGSLRGRGVDVGGVRRDGGVGPAQ